MGEVREEEWEERDQWERYDTTSGRKHYRECRNETEETDGPPWRTGRRGGPFIYLISSTSYVQLA